jgi:S1-C subfamily serine protease
MKLDRPGVMIDTVVPGTPAAEAKLQSRDVIVGMNGQAIEELGTPSLTAENLERSIARIPVGKELQLSVFRDGKMFSAAIKTVGLPAMPYEVERYYSSFLGFGVRLRVMLDDYLEGGPTAKVPGLIVYMVLANTPAQVAQVNGNDVVLSIAGTPVNNIDSFKRIEQRILADKSLKEVDMEIARGDRKETLKLPLPKR